MRTYLIAWLGLLLLLGLSAGQAYLKLGFASNFIPLGLAILQAAIIAIVFMKLNAGPSLKWIFAGAGFFWLMVLIGLSATDYFTRSGYGR